MLGIEPPRRLGTSRLPDGRRVAWSEWGPEDGRPVLLSPGAATSRWLGFGADVVDRLGVRLVSLDRPGLGASDPRPGRDLLGWAADVAEVVRLRELGRPPAVAFSQGAPAALAWAAAGVLGGLAVVAGTDELAAPDVRRDLVPDVARLVDLCAADPDAAAAAFAGLADPDAMAAMVAATSGPADLAVYREPAFAAAYRRALEEAFAQGPDGYVRDTVLSMTRWPFDPGEIAVPVDLWYGRLDTSPVHSPDLGERLHRRIPGSRRHVVEDAGGALLWTGAGDVLSALLGREGAGRGRTVTG
ncbi:alpha/beta fold hydrolase [Geodermatophilus sp. SYSU D00815]